MIINHHVGKCFVETLSNQRPKPIQNLLSDWKFGHFFSKWIDLLEILGVVTLKSASLQNTEAMFGTMVNQLPISAVEEIPTGLDPEDGESRLARSWFGNCRDFFTGTLWYIEKHRRGLMYHWYFCKCSCWFFIYGFSCFVIKSNLGIGFSLKSSSVYVHSLYVFCLHLFNLLEDRDILTDRSCQKAFDKLPWSRRRYYYSSLIIC